MIFKIRGKKLKIKVCKSYLSKVFGLMFSTMKNLDGALLCFDKEDKYAIHMFFVFQHLDIVWLDSKKRVVDVQRAVPFAFKIYKPRKAAKYILELKKDILNLKIGEQIRF
ncbi:MAG: DUF192 domain-containing protein [Candidatus Parvarchaeota archaeon]|nr:DUF192 domain-containing protein [Candidatus Jingweiarchaeum tengchongense]MCW1298489.1 DUF192 domain-containing protein [Candidatus Jingweiarchaeum tengchongense]MCW1300265.1 DUF192 domain-containing protein [Candidatus Jingweiarchaeum tengchongense]MCW1304501.1 DUF192 domain-containing protein [Candidatus Jingweiarchaeum tengchongense]MCW1305771.1 DUF192 domain-containing protein [Candidatus Jingweiarchaeum tengchongense]